MPIALPDAANTLAEAAEWETALYQIETDDPVLGGPTGIANLQARQLANRTAYLKALMEIIGYGLAAHEAGNHHPLATLVAKGMVLLASAAEAIAGEDAAKAVTPAALAAVVALLAPKASPALTGTPTAPTAAPSTNTTQLATTAFVQAAITALVNGAPGVLDTLNELAAALGNDANFAATITTALASMAPLASPALTGTPTAPTAGAGTNTTQIASTAFVQAAVAAVAVSGLRALAYLDIGQGMENDGANGVRIKLDGTSLSRSAAGLKVTSPAASAKGAISNLAVQVTSNTQINVTVDEAVLEDGSNGYFTARSANLTISTASVGANALDTGAVANATWYAVWVIAKADGTVAGLLSASTTAPTLPSGYSFKARVGMVRTNGSALLYRTTQNGRRAEWIVDGTLLTARPVLASGSTSNVTTAVAWATGAPPTTGTLIMQAVIWASNGTYWNFFIGPSSTDINACFVNQANQVMVFSMIPLSSNFYWSANQSGCNVYAYGWEDNI